MADGLNHLCFIFHQKKIGKETMSQVMTRGPSWFIFSSLWRRDCHPVVGFHWKASLIFSEHGDHPVSYEHWKMRNKPGLKQNNRLMTGHPHMFPAKECQGPGTCSSGAMPRWSSHRADVWSAPQAIPIWTNHHFLYFLILNTPQTPV